MHWVWLIVMGALVVIIIKQHSKINRLTIERVNLLRDFKDLEIERDNLWRKLDSIENPYESLKNEIKEDKLLDNLLDDL